MIKPIITVRSLKNHQIFFRSFKIPWGFLMHLLKQLVPFSLIYSLTAMTLGGERGRGRGGQREWIFRKVGKKENLSLFLSWGANEGGRENLW